MRVLLTANVARCADTRRVAHEFRKKFVHRLLVWLP